MNNNRISKQARVARAATLLVFVLLIVASSVFFFWQREYTKPYLYSPSLKTLLYHLVSDETYGDNEYLFVKKADFEAQLREIQRLELDTYFADEPQRAGGKPGVCLTFDDGYIDNYETVFPLLKKYNMKATIFLISDMIDMPGHLSSEQIREMSESGLVHFGSHTKSHPKLDTLSEELLQEELTVSKEILEALTGKPVLALAYPNGVANDTVEAAAQSAGYRFAYTTDRPQEAYYDNTLLPRYYVTRDMEWAEFTAIFSPIG